jgi:hypothetical protein
MDIKKLFQKKSQFATRKVGEELILVPLQSNISDMDELFTLNETGCYIWEQLNENSTVENIISAMLHEFDTDEDTARKDLESFLLKLSQL